MTVSVALSSQLHRRIADAMCRGNGCLSVSSTKEPVTRSWRVEACQRTDLQEAKGKYPSHVQATGATNKENKPLDTTTGEPHRDTPPSRDVDTAAASTAGGVGAGSDTTQRCSLFGWFARHLSGGCEC